MINSNITRRSEDPLASEKIQVERKIFFLDLKENQRGRFLKITEDVSGRRDTIMLPASALQEFVEALTRILDIEQRLYPVSVRNAFSIRWYHQIIRKYAEGVRGLKPRVEPKRNPGYEIQERSAL